MESERIGTTSWYLIVRSKGVQDSLLSDKKQRYDYRDAIRELQTDFRKGKPRKIAFFDITGGARMYARLIFGLIYGKVPTKIVSSYQEAKNWFAQKQAS